MCALVFCWNLQNTVGDIMNNNDERKPQAQTTQSNPLLSVQTSKPETQNRNFEVDRTREKK